MHRESISCNTTMPMGFLEQEVAMHYQKISIVEAMNLINEHRADKIADASNAILKLHKEGCVLLDNGAKIFTEIGLSARRRRADADPFDKYVRKYVIGS